MKYKILAAICFLLFAFVACEDNKKTPPGTGGGTGGNGNEGKDSEYQLINEWIYDDMGLYYYWNEKLPSSTTLDFDAKPDKFFYSLLYYPKDRFSYIKNNGVEQERISADTNTPKKDIGFEFAYISSPIDKKKILGLCVLYVKKGSKADKEDGIKRGDIIKAVDGVSIANENWYSALHDGKTSYELEFYNKEPLLLETTNSFLENPILLDTIYNEKVGYIVYNSFENGQWYEYAFEMNRILEKMTSLEYLILDLRYNGGGLVKSGNYIASAIVPNREEGGEERKVYTRRIFNKRYDELLRKQSSSKEEYNNRTTEYFYNDIKGTKIPQLNLKKLYVLTSENTASASEQIINGLSAYMQVEVIGQKTMGKNMESFSIEDKKNKNHKWVLQPLTSVSYRSDLTPDTNDYSKGIDTTLPTEKQETKEFHLYNTSLNGIHIVSDAYELGDKRETLLKIALDDIGVEIVDIPDSEMPILRTKRSTRGTLMHIAGSSLDRKPKKMIIDLKE